VSITVHQVREKIDAVEDALRGTETDSRLISREVEDAATQQIHRAIVDCLKAIAEALEQIERHTT
jgi:hypothetical protein